MNLSILANCHLLIEFIRTLEDELVQLFPGNDQKVVINEFHLPADYEHFLKWSNGFYLFGTEILGVKNKEYDILETTKWEQTQSSNLIPGYLIPFSPAGNGDYYCFNLMDGLDEHGLCPIVYWQWNYSSENNFETVNSSFVEWLKELIDESLMDGEE